MFRKDPKVTSVRPEKSIASGGIRVNVRGSGFGLIQRPHLVVMESDRAWLGPRCTIMGDETMTCLTPDLHIPKDRLMQPTKDHPLMLDYGLEIDGNRAGSVIFCLQHGLSNIYLLQKFVTAGWFRETCRVSRSNVRQFHRRWHQVFPIGRFADHHWTVGHLRRYGCVITSFAHCLSVISTWLPPKAM